VRINVGSDYQEHYTFDQYKRPSSTVRTIGARTYTTTDQYNQASQRLQTALGTYQYDSAGRVSSIAGAGGVGVSSMTYDIAGQMSGDTLNSSGWNNGYLINSATAETFGYDTNRMQLISQTAVTTNTNAGSCVPSCPPPPPGGTNLSLTYTYQASAGQMGVGTTAGNAGQLMSVSGTIGGLTESASYSYDNYGRLVTSNQTSNGSSAQRRFAYDRWGNRSGVWDATSGGNQIQSISLQTVSFPGTGSAPTNRITSVTSGSTLNYSYDANGNATNDGMHSYTYDSENRVMKVDSGAAVYAYDHHNRRYKKTVGSSVTHYVWEGNQVVGEYNGANGVMLVSYSYAGSRLIGKTASSTQVLLSDRLSVRLALSDVGVIAGRQATLPFGEDFAESGSQEKHHFTSYESDSESGANYAVNRQYSQAIGEFNRPDPEKNDAGQASIPKSWNRYSYALNNPVNFTDPSGLLLAAPGECYNLLIDGMPFGTIGDCSDSSSLGEGWSYSPPKATCGDFVSGFDFFLTPDEEAIAEAVFSESSGQSDQESAAIAYVILNRTWFLNVPGLTDTHGFGPRNASVRQVLGAAGQFPEYDSNGNLRGSAQARLERTLAGDPATPDCQLLYKANIVVYAITLGNLPDPFAAQGGSWYFAQAQFGRPGRMCRDCSAALGNLGSPHWFYTFPYTNYTGGQRPPWLT
jgi:RHS repeat-associated protein